MRKFCLTIVSVAVIAATTAVPAAAFTGECGTLGILFGKCGARPVETCQTAERNASCGTFGCKTPVSSVAPGCKTAQSLDLNRLLAQICWK